MKIILLKNVGGVGQRDQVKEVSDGYALNYLIPNGLAEQASAAKIATIESRQKASAESEALVDKAWREYTKQLGGARLTVSAKANEQGHLYHQLPLSDIVVAIQKATGLAVPESALHIHTPIKKLGESAIEIRHGAHAAIVTLEVVAQ